MFGHQTRHAYAGSWLKEGVEEFEQNVLSDMVLDDHYFQREAASQVVRHFSFTPRISSNDTFSLHPDLSPILNLDRNENTNPDPNATRSSPVAVSCLKIEGREI